MIAPRFARLTWLLALAGLSCTGLSCTRKDPASSTGGSKETVERAASVSFVTFEDVTAASGITFQRDNGFDGKSWRVVETVNGGVAVLDYDGDGLLDVYFTNGRKMRPGSPPPANALYRNRGGMKFEDVTSESGTGDSSLSMGCSVADVDGDGRPDIYVTNLGPNRLYRNLGTGAFEEIAAAAGVASESMDAGCAFLDMDRDGDLDLYVASYVNDTRTEHPPLVFRGVPGYWPPLNYEPALDHLYENTGDGKFVDVSTKSGIRDAGVGRGLGVIVSDFNGDGLPDLFVANDLSANFMFLGDGTGRFEESAFLNGTAFGEDGNPLGSMGLDSADFDADGLVDLVVTNYHNQPNNLYRAIAENEYEEMALIGGIGAGTLPEVSWGVHFADFDHDGREDLFVANGHLNPGAREIVDTTSYEQVNRMFRNVGRGRFQDVGRGGGEALAVSQVSRGSSAADLDNDGDLDLVIANSNGPPQLLRNDVPPSRSWALIELLGSGHNLDAIGARVSVTSDGRKQWRERRSSASYLSVNDPRLHFGLGDTSTIDRLEVRWPDGKVEVHEDLPVRRVLTVRQGDGKVGVRSP